MGEEVGAWIRFKPGFNELTYEELKEYCKGHLAHYKIPKYVHYVEDYPLTATGKVKKNVLRDLSNEMVKDGKLVKH